MYAIGQLRNLVSTVEVRQRHIVNLNSELRQRLYSETIEVDNTVETGSLTSVTGGKKYIIVTLNFKKENQKIRTLFLKDYAGSDSLTSEDRDELKKFSIEKDADFNNLDSPGLLHGVWFINPAALQITTSDAPSIVTQSTERLKDILNAVVGGKPLNEDDKAFVVSESARYGYNMPDFLIERLNLRDDYDRDALVWVIEELIFMNGFDKEEEARMGRRAQFVSGVTVLGEDAINHEYCHFMDPLNACFAALDNFKDNSAAGTLLVRIDETRKKINISSDISIGFSINNRPSILRAVNNLAAEAARETVSIAEDTVIFLKKQDGDFTKYIKSIQAMLDRVKLFMALLQKIGRSLTEPDIVSELDINELLKEVANTAFAVWVRHGFCKLNMKLDGMVPQALFYPQIWFVPMNLCTNITNANTGGNKVVEVTIESAYNKDDNEIVFSVTDTGIGIPDENLKRIWLYGFTTTENGTGRGLPIAKAVLRCQGGRIDVRSKPGEGAVFTVHLPIYNREFLALLKEMSEHSLESVFDRRESLMDSRIEAETAETLNQAIKIYFEDIGIANLLNVRNRAYGEHMKSRMRKETMDRITELIQSAAGVIKNDQDEALSSVPTGVADNDKLIHMIRRTLTLKEKHLALADDVIKKVAGIAPDNGLLRDTARYFKNSTREFFDDLDRESSRLGMSDNAQAEANRIHDENMKPEYMPTIPDKTILCHIITDSIVPVEQQNMLQVSLEQDMEREAAKGADYREGFACLSGANAGNSDGYIKDLQSLMQKKLDDYRALGYTDVRFDVACPDTGLVSAILGSNLGVKALAFEPCKGTDFNFAQVEGIMLALRALDSGDVEKLKSAFTFLAGNRLSLEQSVITDIDKFIKTVSFILPAAKIEDYDERKKLNDLIAAKIKQAA